MRTPPRPLGDGFVLRSARPDDAEQICHLLAERGDDADAEDLLLVADDPDEGWGSVLVVELDGRVVSTATLLRETVWLGDVAIPAGQVEMVATDRSVEGRGLVRALMDEAHRMSADRGDLLQVMIGIPFFYRQFGYAYAMPIPLLWEVAEVTPADPAITVRTATDQDVAALRALETDAQAHAEVRMPHSAGCCRWLIARSGSDQVVAERDGVVVASTRRTPPDDEVVLAEVAGSTEGIEALIAATADGAACSVVERPGTALDAVLSRCASPPDDPDRAREWFYARVPALGPLLGHIGPVLADRLRMAGIDGDHEVLLSSWRSHVRFTIGTDGVRDLVVGGPEQAPVSKGGSGVPPDVLPALLLGPHGAGGLESRHPDVMLGSQRALMETLFPPVRSDLSTFYLPV